MRTSTGSEVNTTRRLARVARVPGAFTIVELLVVMSIIAILVGLLIPAVGAVRRVAREAASKAVLASIDTGLATFKADDKLGGAYPPSFSDGTGSNAGMVTSPFSNSPIDITGAGLLVWALSGADLLGTPGFPKLGLATWSQASGSNPNNPSTNAYALRADGQEVHTRRGPYVDTSKLQVTRNEGTSSAPNFVVPAEMELLETGTPQREYPLYLDGFGYPVLYWRADPAGKFMVGQTRSSVTGQMGRYWWEDNAVLVGSWISGGLGLGLNSAKLPHALAWGQSDPPTPGTFEHYIMDPRIQAKLWPQRPDSYLLVTPGHDGVYGSADDVTNFDHQGQ